MPSLTTPISSVGSMLVFWNLSQAILAGTHSRSSTSRLARQYGPRWTGNAGLPDDLQPSLEDEARRDCSDEELGEALLCIKHPAEAQKGQETTAQRRIGETRTPGVAPAQRDDPFRSANAGLLPAGSHRLLVAGSQDFLCQATRRPRRAHSVSPGVSECPHRQGSLAGWPTRGRRSPGTGGAGKLRHDAGPFQTASMTLQPNISAQLSRVELDQDALPPIDPNALVRIMTRVQDQAAQFQERTQGIIARLEKHANLVVRDLGTRLNFNTYYANARKASSSAAAANIVASSSMMTTATARTTAPRGETTAA
ncbi:hypothetical protein L7F22_021351 [Adiantum nelumboides]|nr:hypothetical protein [Adiantum nelumboides]